MEPDCRALIVERIRQKGPITVAEYMDLALYAPGAGYYARATQRSGRAGDFVTSVDVGPLFGELLSIEFGLMWRALLRAPDPLSSSFQLVESAAGNGRLSRDILDAAVRRDPEFYRALSLSLVERSAIARSAQRETLGPHAPALVSSSPDIPDGFTGVLFANELLDAFPVHAVAQTRSGLREVYVAIDGDGLVERLGPLSTPALGQYFEHLGITLEPGARAEVNLAAVDWIAAASARMTRGYLVLIDYGYDAETLYARERAVGTLTTFHRHLADAPGRDAHAMPAWLVDPGQRDLTTHVDFTTIRREAEAAGFTVLGMTDQTRFLLRLVEEGGLLETLSAPDRMRDRLALKTLLVPGGMGSSHSVLVLGKDVPAYRPDAHGRVVNQPPNRVQ